MPLNEDRIITLNLGVGRDSSAMLVLLAEEMLHTDKLGVIRPHDIDAVVFSDTGVEWGHTYLHLERCKEACFQMGVPLVVLEKGDERYHYRPDLMSDYMSRQTVASLGKGDCTDNHKIQPIRRWINEQSIVRFGLNNRQWSHRVRSGELLPHVSLIGIAADETSRLSHATRSPAYHEEDYPLITMGIAKENEWVVLDRWGWNDVRKSGCFVCPYQPIGWYWALRESHPGVWDRVVEYEEASLARNKNMNITGVKAGKRVLRIEEVVERWRRKHPRASIDAVLDKSYAQGPAGARAAREERKTL